MRCFPDRSTPMLHGAHWSHSQVSPGCWRLEDELIPYSLLSCKALSTEHVNGVISCLTDIAGNCIACYMY